MPSLKDLKKRIVSVKNTQQTTKAMKMVSAAKLRRAQDLILGHRPYAQELAQLLGAIARASGSVHSEFFKSDETAAPKARKVLLVLVTSDRGLCGAFNANVSKTALRWINEHKKSCERIAVSCIGKKGNEFFREKSVEKGPAFGEIGAKGSMQRARKISDQLIDLYLTGEFNEIRLIYNEFKNAISQVIVESQFLPIDPSQWADGAVSFSPVIKPSAETVFQSLVKKTFPVQIYKSILESLAGEHGARMSAMENATKNAGEMMKKLTLQYNKQRQAGITKELLEIISGSESQNQSK